jgi:hypothetical protein
MVKYEDTVGQRGEAVAEKEQPPVPVGEEPADRGARSPAEVHRHAQAGEAARAIGRRQEVADHGGSGRPVEVDDEAEGDEERHEEIGRGDDSHRHREDARAEEAHQEGAAPAEAVGDDAARQDRHDRTEAVGEEQPRRLGLAHVEVPEKDESQVGDDEGPQLVDERPHDQETHGARETPDDPERALEHGPNAPLYNGPPHRRE